MYDTAVDMNDTQLPSVYIKKESKRMRIDEGFYHDGRRLIKIRKDDGYIPPRSLFDRPSPALVKIRKDLKQQKNRGLIRAVPFVNFKNNIPLKTSNEPEGMTEWFIFEDRTILNVIQNIQGLPINLIVISPGHTQNWDLVADIVNQTSRTYRSPKQCRWRYEAVILPREEGKLLENTKKQKKNKVLLKSSMKSPRTPRTSQLYVNDNNNSFIKLTKNKFETIKTAMTKKQLHLKKYIGNTSINQKHLTVLTELQISNYDIPLSPLEIAHRCYERLIQERNINQQKIEQQVKMQVKQSQSGSSTQILTDHSSPIHIQQQTPNPQTSSQQQQISQLSQATIVVQPNTGIVSSGQVVATALVHNTQMQTQRIQTQTINLASSGSSQQPQIMKAIVASPSGAQQTALLTGIIPQIHINPQSMQNSQSNLIQTSSVSVVLTSPPTTVTTVQPQIVSIQPTVATSTPVVVAQSSGSIVQTLNPQGPQMVSVSQLALSSTSLTTNVQGSSIATAPHIRQRSVSKEIVFQHRPGQQNPTVISLSGLTGQGLTQLQNATLRFTQNYQPNQLRATAPDQKVVAASGTKRFELVTAGTSQLHIYGQQQVRQKLRFLQTAQISQSSAQTTISSSNNSGVGSTVQVQSGQKITVATINSPTIGASQTQNPQIQSGLGQNEGNDISQVSSNVTVHQVAPQQRTQFIKQLSGTSSIGQNTNQKLVMLQRELPQQYKGGQLQLTQTQLAYSGNIQLQQASSSTSGGQHLTTFLKKSTPSGSSAVAGTSQIGVKLSPVRTQNQTVRQVAIPHTVTMGTIPSARKAAPKITTRIAPVTKNSLVLQPKDEGKYTIQELRPIKSSSIFLSNQNVSNQILSIF